MKRSAEAQKRYRLDEQTLALYEQLVQDDDEERALTTLAEAITSESLPEMRVALHEALGHVGDLERAYALCLQATQKNANSGPLWRQLGELAVALDQCGDAIAHFEKAETLGEDSGDLYQLWAASEVALGNRAHATELFGIALEIGHDRVSEVYSAWGKALCDAGVVDEAKTKLLVAIAADATAFYPHAYLGVAHLRSGAPDAAEQSFRRALELIPQGHEAYAAWITLELASVLQASGRKDDARAVTRHNLQHGQRSLGLFEKLRTLQAEALSGQAKHFVIVVAGEDAEGDYYEECEVDAEDEDAALRFIRAVHHQSEAEALVAADVKTTGKAQGPFAGVTDISDKTRVPEMNAGIDDDDD